jgi:protein SCO1/2
MRNPDLIILLLSTLLCIGCGADDAKEIPSPLSDLPYFVDSAMTPVWISADSVETLASHVVGPFDAIDHDGRPMSRDDMAGRIVVVDFFFTACPGICPRLSKSMARLHDSLAGTDDVLLLSFSVTPERDSVPVLRRYADTYGATDERWRLLTGDRDAIYDLARRSFFARVDTTPGALLHTELFYLVDRSGRIRGVYNGTLGTDVMALLDDARRLQR